MDNLSLSYRRKITRAGLACVLGACSPQILPPLAAQESVVQQEMNRRAENSRQAYDLLKTGDAAYQKQDYEAAVKDYSRAFDLLPKAARTEEIRVIAAERYATSATERARKLAKTGDYAAARTLLDTVLKPEIAPTHMGALKLRQQIDDPIRYNHALTPEHVQDVVKVGRNLREAEGFFQLGQYDRALTIYKSVLRTDPYNKAARRGMERVVTAKTDYFRAANDHTRAELLSQVDQAWETYVAPSDSTPDPIEFNQPSDLAPDTRDRLAGIVVDVVDLDNVSVEEALDFVRLQSRLADAPGPNGEASGINVVFNPGLPDSDTARSIGASRINLKARSLPISKLLDYIADQSGTQWRTDGVGVIVTPLGSTDATLSSRTFRVPPNFLSSAATKESADEGNIFDSGNDNNGEGLLKKRISITEFLKQNGVSFPDGASATYTRSNNLLTVRNTPDNIDLVDQLVSIIAGEAPIQVKIQTSMIRVSETKLKELGFDWAITPWSINQNLFMGGGSVGNGSDLGSLGSIDIGGNGVTSGNRSGNSATTSDSIDALISEASGGTSGSTSSRAPGILSLTYIGSGVQVQMMMRGLDQNKGTDVMVNPSVVSRSGERSKIEIKREFIYPTEYEPPELPNSIGNSTLSTGIFPVTPATPTAFETRNVGVTLEVEPTVSADKNFIELSLRPELVEFQGFVNYGSPIYALTDTGLLSSGDTEPLTLNSILMPVFKTIRMPNSAVTIQDGSTVVLGGLMTSRKSKVEDKTPILGDIPYVGRLFRSEAESTFNEAVIISVHVELVDPTGKPWRNR
ncbi:hypothetical protein JIN77_12165 [Verrucomicrobiaceae bacterium R5-34]|nr:hypothetical protein [Verrucomicrobiaceae bacterium R5-34]